MLSQWSDPSNLPASKEAESPSSTFPFHSIPPHHCNAQWRGVLTRPPRARRPGSWCWSSWTSTPRQRTASLAINQSLSLSPNPQNWRSCPDPPSPCSPLRLPGTSPKPNGMLTSPSCSVYLTQVCTPPSTPLTCSWPRWRSGQSSTVHRAVHLRNLWLMGHESD